MNCPKEFELDALNNFCATRVFFNSKCYKECMSSLALLPTRKFIAFERQFLLQYYTQGATFKCLYLIRVYSNAFYKNVNNNVNKDFPYPVNKYHENSDTLFAHASLHLCTKKPRFRNI